MPIIDRLPCQLGILIPSRDRHDKELTAEVKKVIGAKVEEWFERRFKGDTSERIWTRPHLIGRFNCDSGEVTVEELRYQFAQCTKKEFDDYSNELVALAEFVAEKANQKAVAIYFNQEMALVANEG